MSGEEEQLDRRAEAELRRLAYRDHLTGLPNRLAMTERIGAALARSRREGRSAALLFVDMDDFKRVNDTLGHVAGDLLLVLVAERLERLGDPRITAGRHGGDEFLLLVGDLPFAADAVANELGEIGERVLASLRAPFTVRRSTFEISASVGASIFPLDALTHNELIEHADQAMYRAKRRGGAQLAVFDAPESHSLLELETTLRVRNALAAGEFELHYQPVVEIAGADALAGLEALLRWRNPDRGLLTPENFLPFIEHSPLVEEVGEWVVDEVCRQLAQWRLRSFSPRVSFNVPARQLKRLGFAELVIATADRLGADPRQLAVEVTENTPVDLEDVLPTLSALCEAGVVLALDDFGTGYSSLARLRTMPFSLLKTDRTFMAGIPGDEIAEELLEGIISLGNTLGLRVIVEGVETAEQARELLRLRCRYAQGFHLGGPVPAAEIERRWGHGGPTSPRSSQASRASSRG